MKNNQQHVQLPSNLIKVETISPKDLLIYLAIKSFQNSKTGKSLVSLDKISERCGATNKTVAKSIDILIDCEYISRKKEGKCYSYSFSPYKNFEPFSYEFLMNPNLTFSEKAYLAASQQFMLEKESGKGKIYYNNIELSKNINLSVSSIKRLDKALMDKHYLNIIKTEHNDEEIGVPIREKIYSLNEFNKAVVTVLHSHEERIENNTDEIQKLKERFDDMEKSNKELVNRLLKENSELRDKLEKKEIKFVL